MYQQLDSLGCRRRLPAMLVGECMYSYLAAAAAAAAFFTFSSVLFCLLFGMLDPLHWLFPLLLFSFASLEDSSHCSHLFYSISLSESTHVNNQARGRGFIEVGETAAVGSTRYF